MNQPLSVGIVGLGRMGLELARRLQTIAPGEVSGYDLNSEALRRADGSGITTMPSLEDLKQSTDVVVTCLPNDAAVRAVYFADVGLLGGGRTKYCIESSTISPDLMREIGAAAVASGMTAFDWALSGGPNEVANGKAVVLTGGEMPEFIASLGNAVGKILNVGSLGDAKTVKIVNNLMTMGNVAVAGEAFSLGVELGMSGEDLYSALSQCGGSSHQFVKRFTRILGEEKRPGFTIDLGLKDLKLGRDLAFGADSMPLNHAMIALYESATQRGMGDADIVHVGFPPAGRKHD